MRNLKTLSLGITAAVAALVPTIVFARKRYQAAKQRRFELEARSEGRKLAHHPKPRKARRIARHLKKATALLKA